MRRVKLGDGPIPVPRAVLAGIDAVRDSGLTNMLNRHLVAEIAATLGHPKTAAWIRKNHADYANGVFRGFAPVDDKGGGG